MKWNFCFVFEIVRNYFQIMYNNCILIFINTYEP